MTFRYLFFNMDQTGVFFNIDQFVFFIYWLICFFIFWLICFFPRWEVAGPAGQSKMLDIGQDIALQDRQKDEMLRHLATLGIVAQWHGVQ